MLQEILDHFLEEVADDGEVLPSTLARLVWRIAEAEQDEELVADVVEALLTSG